MFIIVHNYAGLKRLDERERDFILILIILLSKQQSYFTLPSISLYNVTVTFFFIG